MPHSPASRLFSTRENERLLFRSVSEVGLLAWSAVHGAAFLLIDGSLEVGQPVPDVTCILDLLHESICSGVGPRN